MGASRFHFANADENKRPEPKIWVTRAVIAGLLVGLASAAHIIYGLRIF